MREGIGGGVRGEEESEAERERGKLGVERRHQLVLACEGWGMARAGSGGIYTATIEAGRGRRREAACVAGGTTAAWTGGGAAWRYGTRGAPVFNCLFDYFSGIFNDCRILVICFHFYFV